MTITNNPETPAGELALEEVEVALAKAPNNSLLGSSTMRIPFPFGLWIYNAFVHSEKGLGKWIFKRMAAKPVFISDVNPELRQKAATNILRDYGFFQGAVTHDILPDKRDSLKAKIQFHVDLNRPYLLDSVEYRGFTPEMMRIIERGGTRTALRRGVQFSVIDLDEERQRLSTIFRNVGYYYFRPEFFAFRADTTQVSGEVDLRIVPQSGIPANALKNWNIGQVTFNLIGKDGEQPDHTVQYQDMTLRYHRSLAIRPEILYRQLRVRTGQRYSQRLVELTQQKLAELGVFSYTDMQFAPNDSVSESNLLNVNVTSGFDFPYDSRLEFNVTSKSNDYAGPGATFSISRKNLFKGGETFTVTATGSYEWQTKSPVSSNTKFNSWEFGLDAGLSYPFVVFPGWRMKDYDFTATTAFALNVNQLNRARFFKMLSFGGSMTYGIQRTRVSRHTITPFSLTFSTLQSRTAEFDEIMATNPALQKSMENQFIPA
ncbi:MAG: hypothetical protein LBM61_05540 [Prevotellaceae bacterium]|nr:hypothetical protein [Prevotellaceae bacterium]